MTLKLDERFKNRVQGMIEKYEFQVGVLEDGPHLIAKRGKRGLKGQDVLKKYAGGPARQVTRKDSGKTIAEVSKELREKIGVNYLTAPFHAGNKAQQDILRFTNEFFKLVFGRSEKRRVENLLQAIVRNPMLRGDYGSNSRITQAIKGFDRKTIDTAQLFKAIIAKCEIKGK